MNINPTLAMGMALDYARDHADELGILAAPQVLTDRTELRVYDTTGAGYHFVRGAQAQRWYYRESADSDHFLRADSESLTAAINDGGHVQITGPQGISVALWDNWQDFAGVMGL